MFIGKFSVKILVLFECMYYKEIDHYLRAHFVAHIRDIAVVNILPLKGRYAPVDLCVEQ